MRPPARTAVPLLVVALGLPLSSLSACSGGGDSGDSEARDERSASATATAEEVATGAVEASDTVSDDAFTVHLAEGWPDSVEVLEGELIASGTSGEGATQIWSATVYVEGSSPAEAFEAAEGELLDDGFEATARAEETDGVTVRTYSSAAGSEPAVEVTLNVTSGTDGTLVVYAVASPPSG